MAYDYEYFKKEVYTLTAVDLSSYKEKQMKRRIDTLIAKHKIVGYDKYVQVLRTDQAKYDEFASYITINVSEFYRNPEQWKLLEETIIPELIKRFGKNLKIWSAACSSGDEPYSLVMALSRFIPLNQIKIFATDLDKQIIAKAKAGIYGEKSIASVPADLKNKYFTKEGLAYKISDDIKARVDFKQHNLLKDTYPTDCNLIVCRNVLIYFTEEAKDEVFLKFSKSLCKGGVLFIGSTEQIINHKDIGLERKNSFFYETPM